ncbi:MAG: GAF domain-containing protein [Candidatus Kaistia colombiensis]|nr:MAG: GAF domain-containing protein [Kaistia sp.]
MLDPLAYIAAAGQAAVQASDAEGAIEAIMRRAAELGDPAGPERAGALDPGQRQFFVSGGFMITPDRQYLMLVGNTGFPAEQKRLMVPIDGGNPGWVVANRRSLVLPNTDEDRSFRQYLKTSRMGSALYAPLLWQGEILGLILVAAQARNTLGAADLAILDALAPLAAANWVAKGGPAWMASTYPPADAWRAASEGLK